MTTPDPIRRFVEATNAGDTEAFLATFTDNAFPQRLGPRFPRPWRHRKLEPVG
jgi:hypothetical protein